MEWWSFILIGIFFLTLAICLLAMVIIRRIYLNRRDVADQESIQMIQTYLADFLSLNLFIDQDSSTEHEEVVSISRHQLKRKRFRMLLSLELQSFATETQGNESKVFQRLYLGWGLSADTEQRLSSRSFTSICFAIEEVRSLRLHQFKRCIQKFCTHNDEIIRGKALCALAELNGGIHPDWYHRYNLSDWDKHKLHEFAESNHLKVTADLYSV